MVGLVTYLWVALGSAVGGVARYLAGLAGAALVGEAFPWTTIFVNATGSLVIGFFSAISSTESPYLVRTEIRVFVMVGICGGYTTFSSFSLQTFALLREGRALAAAANVILSMLVCLISVWLGSGAGDAMIRRR
jgi:fluoride exporter